MESGTCLPVVAESHAGGACHREMPPLVSQSVFIENVSSMPPKLSIVVPAFNEGERLGATIPKILAHLNSSSAKSELIVVDDGSDDDTVEVAERALAQSGSVETRLLRYEKNRGKG